MKLKLLLIGLFLPLLSFSQNLRILSDFNDINMSISKYEAESKMVTLKDFEETRRDKFNIDNYSWIEYNTADSSMAVMLCFYKNILYRKVLGLRYSKGNLDRCKDEWLNIRRFALTKYKPVKTGRGEMTNDAYGGSIGYNYTYYLDKNNTKQIEAEYFGRLQLDYTYKPFTATIKGYMTEFSITDISQTTLSYKIGVSTFQLD
ncbi:MAG TPA: hypothetical protein VIJ57_09605 [Hanamia sp.]